MFLSISVAAQKLGARKVSLWKYSGFIIFFFITKFSDSSAKGSWALQMFFGLSTALYNKAESRNAHWNMKSKRKSNCFLRSLMACME